MRISKVYTRTGDEGKTRLAGGIQVFKDDQRVEAYGTIDELNVAIGTARAFIAERLPNDTKLANLDKKLHVIQNKLFDVGAILATPRDSHYAMKQMNKPSMFKVTENDVTCLELLIDSINAELHPLQEFILPGGGKAASFLHMARTICRRAERQCVTLSRAGSLSPTLLIYLNRLSDTLFVLARLVAKIHGEPEHFWKQE
tara:strand:- start:974 stop:1573 length:600 start_codon:yes stop_codon:yes gene_type:complete